MVVRFALLPLLALPLGFFSVILGLGEPKPLQPSGLQGAALQIDWQSPWIAGLAPDPVIDAIVADYLAGLERQGWSIPDQGIWIQAGSSAVAQHQGTLLLPAASLTKLATTLAALKTWPIDHRFETLVGINGTVENGVLYGDLVVQGGGDPLFVWEEGIVLANQLQALGIQQVTGDLLVTGSFTMNFEEDPNDSLAALRQAMAADAWNGEAQTAYQTLPPDTPRPSLLIDGESRRVEVGAVEQTAWIIRHESLPLIAILKAMNIHSNNTMAQMVADLMGGPGSVMDIAIATADLPPGEIHLVNGSGLGLENQLSPRAAVALTVALQKELSQHNFSVADVLPVSGEDIGTLIDRQIPLTAAVKTGSLAEVSALAGMLPTADKGPVWFAILNRGWAIGDLRVQQDQLLHAIQAHWGVADAPPALDTKVHMQSEPFRYGDPDRNVKFQPGSE
ncbi:MAG: D-alanyl-D-alanine carboxypeptidase [Nodosilinea sp.]